MTRPGPPAAHRPPLLRPGPPRRAHHDVPVHEAPAVPRGLQVRVLLGAGAAHVPHLLPGAVERAVHGVHARVVRGHRVARVRRDPVLLGPSRVGESGVGGTGRGA